LKNYKKFNKLSEFFYMTILCLDLGSKNIGVAVSDDTENLAMPLTTIVFDENGEFINKLQKIILDYKITELVIGAPYSLNIANFQDMSAPNFALKKTLEKIELIKKKVQLPIYFQDERFTSAAAQKSLTAAAQKIKTRKKNKKLKNIDAIAAAYILEAYLGRKNKK